MLDIDDFSNVNNTYGHDIGDMVLSGTAAVLKGSCRDIDIITRFGGDEFTVIMPDTDVFGARILADRMMKEAKGFQYDTGHGFKASITLSIGIATYPGHGKNAGDLMRSADSALLKAKKKGKDRCVMAIAAKE
jgi:diguanylate cyclase (GGDEF)-like protein